MLNKPLPIFFELLNNSIGDNFKFVSEDHSSRKYRLADINANFILELSEARIHSRIMRDGVESDSSWRCVLASANIARDLNINSDILIWNGNSLYSSNAVVTDSLIITQVELSSRLINIHEVNELLMAISEILDLTNFILLGVLVPSAQEGGEKNNLSKRYERSRLLRDAAIRCHGVDCAVCGFNFEKLYGDIGRDFIHIHHLEQLAESGQKMVNPVTDLIPVCPNCHSMLHKFSPPLMPVDLKKLLHKRRIQARSATLNN
jgi:predicted HNH restriction endonuclease